MGAGHHGGFGNTYGSKAISLSPIYAGDENNLKTASKWIAPKSGYTDIIVHGSPDHVEIKKVTSGFQSIIVHSQECTEVIKDIQEIPYVLFLAKQEKMWMGLLKI